ncbi:MAG TPA: hypothetical protein VF353_05475, partial [Candidatus Binatia bacterium]
EEPWSLPQQPTTAAPLPLQAESTNVTPTLPPVSPDLIIKKNLFDPERGAGATLVAESNSRSFQRIRNMVLLGTVILGDSRSAILQDPAPQAATSTGAAAPVGPMRVKLGESVEGFRLTEIADRRVVFTKGGSKVEVLLDYFRRDDPPPTRAGVPPRQGAAPAGAPRVVPNLPRRGALPAPPSPNPES